MCIFIKAKARSNAGELLLVLLCMAMPWAVAHADPDAKVDVSATHATYAGDTADPRFSTTTDAQLANTADGTVTRSAGVSHVCCGISAFASSTTSSTSASWQLAAARSKSVIDVIDWSSEESQAWMPVPDKYDASAVAEYTIPWRIEHSSFSDGEVVEVDVRAIMDGTLSIDFPTSWQYYWEPGDPITPGNFEGITDHATVGFFIALWVERLSTGGKQLIFNLNAELDTMPNWRNTLLDVDPSEAQYYTDLSFRIVDQPSSIDNISALRYRVDVDEILLNSDRIDEIDFVVGEVYELRLLLGTSASLANHSGPGRGVTLTSDFSDTASYEMVSPDPGVSFVALNSSDLPGPDDSDGDGIPDLQDVCPGGDDNTNTDGDLSPDFCDICPFDADNDADGDGVCGDVDVCEDGDDTVNWDGDALPDFCDACPHDPDNDTDGDGVCGNVDVCPIVSDPGQTDTDGDSVGDACDFDDDNDGICDDASATICTAGPDNCPLHKNSDQTDFDGDGLGDVCDSDDDNDSVPDGADACLATGTGEVVEANGCSVNDQCPCGSSWKNHGAYVRCVAHTSEDFVAAGLITEVEKGTIVSTAGMSSCGVKR